MPKGNQMKIPSKKNLTIFLVGFLLFAGQAFSAAGGRDNPLTVAEASGFTATATHAQVLSFIQALKGLSPNLKVETMATTTEGRPVPLLILGRPVPNSPDSLRRDPRLVVYIQANIHAGEVEGKEASLMLARDILLNPRLSYLDKLVVLIAPDFNPDGNDKISPENRRYQPGPEKGVGVRMNGQNLDLNRDAMKLETPEDRGLVENVLRRWDPALLVDCHTTDGYYHQEPVTYAWPLNPNGDPQITEFMRDKMLPAVAIRLKKDYGTLSLPYGDPRDMTDLSKGLENDAYLPRYLTNYVGLRNRLAILDENYVYADYKTRVLACNSFLRAILDECRQNAQAIKDLIRQADERASQRFSNAVSTSLFHTAFELQPLPDKITFQGFEQEVTPREGTFPLIKKTDRQKTYTVDYYAQVVPQHSLRFPWGYFLTYRDPCVLAILRAHGLIVERLTQPVKAQVESFRVTELRPAERLFQGHWMNRIKGAYASEEREFPAGTLFVTTAQPLGNLAACLLEPESDDGLAVWNFFDRVIVPEWGRGFESFPVFRVLQPMDMTREIIK
jgi:dipeptidyl-peptidase-4